MHRFVFFGLFCLLLVGCAMVRPFDSDEQALFAALFDGPAGGSCRQLRRDLKAAIEDIKAAQKKADEDFIAEQSAPQPQPQAPPQRFARRSHPRNDEMAPLKDVARQTKQAEEMNLKLKVRGCRTIDVEQALKAPAQEQTPAPTQ